MDKKMCELTALHARREADSCYRAARKRSGEDAANLRAEARKWAARARRWKIEAQKAEQAS